MGSEFTFYDYFRPGSPGTNPIRDWLDGDGKTGKAALTARLQLLEAWPVEKWNLPYARRDLHGNCGGLFEVRAKASRTQWRLLGFFGPGAHEATLVFGAKEIGDRFVPRTACDQAQAIKAYILECVSFARREHDFG